ncbi:MAG: TetR/AcrR family transcriptional regulator [Anaerovoracaceae bacterium]
MTEKEDLRVVKTKKDIKDAMRRLLAEKEFDRITVTEICNEAMTSRITFYRYYGDKYDLLDDLFSDLADMVMDQFAEIQKGKEDPGFVESMDDLLTCFLDAYRDINDIINNVSILNNAVLLYPYYHFMKEITEKILKRYKNAVVMTVPVERIMDFLVFGLFGCTQMSGARTDEEWKEYKKQAHILFDIFLSSGIIKEKKM